MLSFALSKFKTHDCDVWYRILTFCVLLTGVRYDTFSRLLQICKPDKQIQVKDEMII